MTLNPGTRWCRFLININIGEDLLPFHLLEWWLTCTRSPWKHLLIHKNWGCNENKRSNHHIATPMWVMLSACGRPKETFLTLLLYILVSRCVAAPPSPRRTMTDSLASWGEAATHLPIHVSEGYYLLTSLLILLLLLSGVSPRCLFDGLLAAPCRSLKEKHRNLNSTEPLTLLPIRGSGMPPHFSWASRNKWKPKSEPSRVERGATMRFQSALTLQVLWTAVCQAAMQHYPAAWGHYDVCKSQVYSDEGLTWDYMACQPEAADMTQYLKVTLDPPNVTCGDPPETYCALVSTNE